MAKKSKQAKDSKDEKKKTKKKKDKKTDAASTKAKAANKAKKSAKKAPDPGPSVNDPEVYQALREQGASKEKAARIANAAARDGRSAVGRRGGDADDYTDRTKAELVERAAELGIKGRSKMRKGELIDALRNH